MQRYYGWRPSYPDYRNYIADTSTLVAPDGDAVIAIGGSIPLFDQGQLGSCTANAANRSARIWGDAIGQDPGNLSRLETYWGERKIEGTLDQGDIGAMGHDAFKWLSKHGCAPESVWPYDIEKFEEKPEVALDHHNPFKITKYVHPNQTDLIGDILKMLNHGQTVIFGFTVFESFESSEVADSGIVPLPSHGEQIVGGHEVLISGSDQQSHSGHLRCDNSWGDGWGDGGRFWMPIDYITSPQLASDHRSIVIPQ